MSCRKWEESIYTYDELTEEEKKSVDQHVKECSACYQVLLEVRQTQQVVSRASIAKAELRNPERLTRKIMDAVEPTQSSVSIFSAVVDHLFTRFALAAFSLVLIVFFIREQQKEFNRPSLAMVKTSGDTSKVILDSKSFLKQIKEVRNTKSYTSITSFYSCAKANECDNTIVKYIKQKKQNENI